jgi:hypothetical protein
MPPNQPASTTAFHPRPDQLRRATPAPTGADSQVEPHQRHQNPQTPRARMPTDRPSPQTPARSAYHPPPAALRLQASSRPAARPHQKSTPTAGLRHPPDQTCRRAYHHRHPAARHRENFRRAMPNRRAYESVSLAMSLRRAVTVQTRLLASRVELDHLRRRVCHLCSPKLADRKLRPRPTRLACRIGLRLNGQALVGARRVS